MWRGCVTGKLRRVTHSTNIPGAVESSFSNYKRHLNISKFEGKNVFGSLILITRKYFWCLYWLWNFSHNNRIKSSIRKLRSHVILNTFFCRYLTFKLIFFFIFRWWGGRGGGGRRWGRGRGGRIKIFVKYFQTQCLLIFFQMNTNNKVRRNTQPLKIFVCNLFSRENFPICYIIIMELC